MDKNRSKTYSVELKELRESVGLDRVGMCARLAHVLGREMPYITYQQYERGARGVPLNVIEAARLVYRADRAFMAELPHRLQRRIDREYPGGIPSEVTET